LPSSGMLLLLLLVTIPLTSCIKDPDHSSDGHSGTITRGGDALETLNMATKNFNTANAAWKIVTKVIDESKRNIEQAAEIIKNESLLVENNRVDVKQMVDKALENLTKEVNNSKNQVERKVSDEVGQREAKIKEIFENATKELKQDPESKDITIDNAIMKAKQEVANMSKELLEDAEKFKNITELAKTTCNEALSSASGSIKSLEEITGGKDTAEQGWENAQKQKLVVTFEEITTRNINLENATSVAKTAISDAEELESNINSDAEEKTKQNDEFERDIMSNLDSIAHKIKAHANVAMTEKGKSEAKEITIRIDDALDIKQQLTNLTKAIRESIQHVKEQAVQAKDVAEKTKTLLKELGSQKSLDFITLSFLQKKKTSMEDKYNIAIRNYELAKGANVMATEEVGKRHSKVEEVINNSTSYLISVSEIIMTNLNTILEKEQLAIIASAATTTTATNTTITETNKPTKSLSNGGRLKSAVFGVTLAVLALVTIAAVLILRRRRNARTASITSSTDLAPAL